MGPLLLDGFAVRPPNTFREVEGIFRLAWRAVTREVELWDEEGK